MSTPKESLTAALAHHKSGRAQEAERLYNAVLTNDPDQPDALHLLGLLHHQRGDHAGAIGLITRAITVHSTEPAFYSNRGEAYRVLGQFVEAVADFQQAIELAPGSAAAQNNLGLTLRSMRRFAEARVALERALAIKPDFPEALNNLGLVLQEFGDWEAAITAFQRSAAVRPGYWEAYNNLAAALLVAERPAEAKNAFETALAHAPASQRPYYLVHIAKIMADTGDDRGAVALLREVIALEPHDTVAFTNLATSEERLDDLEASIADSRRAIELKPDYADPHRNLGTVLLTLGRYAEGWPEYAWRWKCHDFEVNKRPFLQPEWDGSRQTKGPLLVWGEQGIGDEILHASMLSDLQRTGGDFLWEADPRLVKLFQRSFPGTTILPREMLPHPDTAKAVAQIPAGNLGGIFRNGRSQFPNERRAYLAANPNASQLFRNHTPARSGELRIGISWASRNRSRGTLKTVPLELWTPVLRTPNVCFIDLQFGDTTDERARAAAEFGIRLHHFEGLHLGLDIDGLAALISACDLVISVSNTTVHLAGALGVPVWVLVPSHAARFWYWGRETSSTPWYPSVELFRQTRDGHWIGVMETVAARLRERT